MLVTADNQTIAADGWCGVNGLAQVDLMQLFVFLAVSKYDDFAVSPARVYNALGGN